MKKIVALVLCLVLALSLCTVAFAAKIGTAVGNYTETKDGHTYTLTLKLAGNSELKTFDVYELKDTDVTGASTLSYWSLTPMLLPPLAFSLTVPM